MIQLRSQQRQPSYLADYDEKHDELIANVDKARTKFEAVKSAFESAKQALTSATTARDEWRQTKMAYRILKGNAPRMFDDPAELADRLYRQNKRMLARVDTILSTAVTNK